MYGVSEHNAIFGSNCKGCYAKPSLELSNHSNDSSRSHLPNSLLGLMIWMLRIVAMVLRFDECVELMIAST